MRKLSTNHYQVVFLVYCLLVLIDTKPNLPFKEVILSPIAETYSSLAERCDALHANDTTHPGNDHAPQYLSTEARLASDGFVMDKHTESSLEHDLNTKLKIIYARVYELADKLEETLAYTCDLSGRLKRTQDELKAYTRNENELVERLKKTEVFVTVLLKKSHVEENDTKEEEEEVRKEFPEVLNNSTKEDHVNVSNVFNDDKQNFTSCNSTNGVENTNSSCVDSSVNKVVLATVQADQNHKKPTFWQNILAKIGFKFVLKRPTEPLLLDAMKPSEKETTNEVRKSGPLVRNITLLINDYAETKPQSLPDLNAKDDPYDDDLGGGEEDEFEANSNGGVFLRDYGSEESHHHHTQYRYSKGDTGPPGTPGLPGAPGVAGPAGAAGTAGLPGAVGPKGEPGVGIPGTNGIPGTQGVAGATGLTGATGNPGVPGIQGVQGPQGDQGPTGLTGPQGDKGDTGTG